VPEALSISAAELRLTEAVASLGEAVRSGVALAAFLELLDRSKPALFERFADCLHSAVGAKGLTVKVMNLCLARYHFSARSVDVLAAPLGLVVDPINNCNLACPGCVHSARSTEEKLFQWNSGMLSGARFGALLGRYGVSALEIMLCNYGEPLMNPQTPSFIRLARTYLMRTGLSTNMTVRRFDGRAYVDSGLDFMTLSLDGATQAVYEKYRRKGDLEAAFQNIRNLVLARRESGRRTPILSWQFLAFEHNAHEIDSAIQIARELGVDQFIVATPFDVSWDDPDIHPALNVEPRVIQFAGGSDRKLIDNWTPFPDELRVTEIEEAFDRTWASRAGNNSSSERSAATHACHWLYKNLVMDATGRVIPCCAAPKAGADLVFDTFTEDTGRDSFNSPKYRAARTAFADPAGYSEEKARAGLESDPHCVNCEWNQETAHTDSAQVEQYLRTVPGEPFDSEVYGTEALRILSRW